jgi:hypothetical protein
MATNFSPLPVDPATDPEFAAGDELVAELSGDGVSVRSIEYFPGTVSPEIDPDAIDYDTTVSPDPAEIRYSPEELDALAANNGVDAGEGGISEQSLYKNENAAQVAAGVDLARQQAVLSAQRGQQQNNDWRVKLQLAPQANYLYNDPNPGILAPLKATNGIIFPYTPKIEMSYKANYQEVPLTHSNYKGYFYQNSNPGEINIVAPFTAQSTADANYLLAVIHFFRTATKMFYGQDSQRGSPPPLVYLSGLGPYQFNNHPCVISDFTYALPSEIDYIRAQTSNQAGLNLVSIRNQQSVATNSIFSSVSRLASVLLTKGAMPGTPFGGNQSPNLGLGSPTYVPTKMDIIIRLLPMQSRQQISTQFSVKNFANGNLLRGGFW